MVFFIDKKGPGYYNIYLMPLSTLLSAVVHYIYTYLLVTLLLVEYYFTVD